MAYNNSGTPFRLLPAQKSFEAVRVEECVRQEVPEGLTAGVLEREVWNWMYVRFLRMRLSPHRKNTGEVDYSRWARVSRRGNTFSVNRILRVTRLDARGVCVVFPCIHKDHADEAGLLVKGSLVSYEAPMDFQSLKVLMKVTRLCLKNTVRWRKPRL